MYNLAQAFTIIVNNLKDIVAPRNGMAPDRFAFLAFLWHRLWSISKRFDKLYTRWKNGTLPKSRAPARPPSQTLPSRTPPSRTQPVSPRRAPNLPSACPRPACGL